MDFGQTDPETPGDPPFFPMYARDEGELFGFCPAKATWYPDLNGVFRVLVICAETGALPYTGSLMDQPSWMVDLLGWFVPKYKGVQFSARAQMILGKAKKEAPGADDNGRSHSKNRR